MNTRVKICGITSVADGLAAAEAGADLVGLMFYPHSPRYVSLAQAAEIAAALPPFVLRVGVFVDAPQDFIIRAIAECQLGMLQFHGQESPETCTRFGLMSMKAIRMRGLESLAEMENNPTPAFLLDAYSAARPGGTGETFNWDLAIAAKAYNKPIFLAGGLTPDNVATAIQTVQPFGVDVSSGVESAPGKKDPGKVAAFIRAAKSAGVSAGAPPRTVSPNA